jgi:protein O-GlcNAc transferase
MLPWLEKHDRINFKIIAYSDREQADAMTIRIRQNVDEWRNAVGKDDEELALQIEKDRVDVLIDLAGHTAGNRLKMFARRIATLQVSWLGYSATTGVPAMDVVLMDDYIAPEDCNKYFTEKLVRLEGLRFCYTPPVYAPEVAPSPFLKNGYLTFGCFNNLAKLTPLVIQSWASILNALPQSRLILKWKSLGDQETARRIQLKFENYGVAPKRIECRGWSKHAAMLAEYSDVDVALDPFPFSGGLTSCDALYMGVPVITMPSELPISRQTGSFLNAIGLNCWRRLNFDHLCRLNLDQGLLLV